LSYKIIFFLGNFTSTTPTVNANTPKRGSSSQIRAGVGSSHRQQSVSSVSSSDDYDPCRPGGIVSPTRGNSPSRVVGVGRSRSPVKTNVNRKQSTGSSSSGDSGFNVAQRVMGVSASACCGCVEPQRADDLTFNWNDLDRENFNRELRPEELVEGSRWYSLSFFIFIINFVLNKILTKFTAEGGWVGGLLERVCCYSTM